MYKKLSSLIAAALVMAIVGCGGTEVNFNSFSNTTSGDNPLSGQTGTVTVQTQLANNQVLAQQSLIIESDIIPSFVDELRFIGQDQDGFVIYGPVIADKAPIIDLNDVPIEVITLRIELLVNGFTVGGLVTPINVPTNDVTFLTNPIYVFAGVESDVDGTVAFGSFRNTGQGGDEIPFPEGQFNVEEAPVIDFPITQVTNGVTRTGVGLFTVTEAGDYLLTYGVEISPFFTQVLTQLIRNNAFVDNTLFDVADTEGIIFFPIGNLQFGGDSRALQTFQHIVTLEAGDVVSLNLRDIAGGQQDARAVNAQMVERPVFGITQGTFSIVRLGEGGVTAPPPEL